MKCPALHIKTDNFPPMLRRKLTVSGFFNRAFVVFLIIGFTNFALGFSVFWLCLRYLWTFPFKTAASQLISYGIVVAWSFYWNRRLAFRSAGPPVKQGYRFIIVQVCLAAISAALIGLCVDVLGLPPGPSWFSVMAAVTVANFLLLKLWVFR